MGFFKRDNKENTGIVEHVKSSFDRVKLEVTQILEWLYFFHQKHQEHDIRLKLVENQLSYMPKTPAEIKKIVDQYYSYDHILNRVRKLHGKVDDLLDTHKPVIRRLQEVETSLSKVGKTNEPLYHKIRDIHSRLETIERKAIKMSTSAPKNALREKIVEKVARNSKEYIKNVIVSLIQKYGSVSGFQLKEMVVDEQGLCSRSSFYRLLAEVERQHPITLTWKGKEKHYAIAISKAINS